MKYYIEIRKNVFREDNTSPLLIPINTVWDVDTSIYSFRSVYAYDDTIKDRILSSGSTKDLLDCPVYSDILYVDIDTNSVDMDRLSSWLKSNNYSHCRYNTGRRGGHFHIPIEPMFGKTVPASQKKWIEDNLGFMTLDLSFYHQAGQFRLPGATHEKTGKQKKCIDTFVANTLNIPILLNKTIRGIGTTKTEYSGYVQNATKYKGLGGRHQHIMIIVKEGIREGLGIDKILKDVLRWNLYWTRSSPLDESEVIRHTYKTYRQYSNNRKGSTNE